MNRDDRLRGSVKKNKVKVKLYDEIDYEYPVWTDDDFKDKYKATVNEIENMPPLWKRINIFSNKKKRLRKQIKERHIFWIYIQDTYWICL